MSVTKIDLWRTTGVPVQMRRTIQAALTPAEQHRAFSKNRFLTRDELRRAYVIGRTVGLSVEEILAALCQFKLDQLEQKSLIQKLRAFNTICFLIRMVNFSSPNVSTSWMTQQKYLLFAKRMSSQGAGDEGNGATK